MGTEFLKPIFKGKRFEGHRVPLEVLNELALIEDLILQAAKWLFLKENEGRKRFPRGWGKGFRLSLTRIEEGSAAPVLELAEEELPNDLLYRPHFERARDLIIQEIREAGSHSHKRSPHLPPQLLNHFMKLGAGLRDDEALELTSPTTPTLSATLNTAIRRRLIPPSQPYFQQVEVVGLVFELNQKRRTYQVLDVNDRTIDARFDAEHDESILDASNAYRAGEFFLIRGNGLHNPDGTLKEIHHTFDVEPAGQNISDLLEKLASLEHGWYDGQTGELFPAEALRWLASAWYNSIPASIPRPALFPTADGEISVEWSIDRWDVSLDIDPVGRTGYFHALQLDTDEDHEIAKLDLNTGEAWEAVVDQLVKLPGRSSSV